MVSASVVYILITIIVGNTFAHEESKETFEDMKSDHGTAGYDLFYYDGEQLRDEKWRFDPKTGSAAVSRRNGFRDKDTFHLVDATLDALGSFTKSYKMKNDKDMFKQRVKEPHLDQDGDDTMNESTKGSNTFSGVSFNTQYSSQNGFPHASNAGGIQQLNSPNLYNGLNIQQAFSTAGFGFQQIGSIFNHPNFPNNFQLSSFLMPFFNQHNNNPNQHQIFGSLPPFGKPGPEMGHEHSTETVATTAEPNVDVKTTTTEMTTTTRLTTTTTTTEDPTLNFDVRLEEEKTTITATNETDAQNIQTTSRRPIEGLPTSDEDDEGGVLDDKINPQVLKTLVG